MYRGLNITFHITTARDPCSSTPCHNRGTCMQVTSGFVCTCAPGWTGERCQNGKDNEYVCLQRL